MRYILCCILFMNSVFVYILRTSYLMCCRKEKAGREEGEEGLPARPPPERTMEELEHVFAALGKEPGVIPIVRTLTHLLLSRSFGFVQLRFGYRVEKTLMLIARLLAAHTEGDTRNHPGTSLSV